MKKIFSSVAKITILSFLILALAPLVVPAISSDAFAQSGTTVSTTTSSNVLVDTVCNVLKIITGNAGKAFAAFAIPAIISVGIGFFTGKVSWGLMIGVAAGIAAMFGAPSIVSAITGKGAYDCGA